MFRLTFIVVALCLFGVVIEAWPETKSTEKMADIMFVLDPTTSYWAEHHKDQLRFVADLVENFGVGKANPNIRVGVITFSDKAHLEIPLDNYKDPDQLQEDILGIPHRGHETNMADALRLLKEQVEPNSENSEVSTIAIVITDGKSRDPSATKEEAKKLHQLGITVYAIGVGNSRMYDINELKSIASDPENGVYTVTSYSTLKGIRQTFSEEVCKECVERAADIMFVLDSSSSIWIDDYKRQLEFVADLVERFGVGRRNNRVRIGAITFSDEAHLDFSLCHYTESSQLKEAILNIPPRGGGTNTADALRLLKQVEPNLKNSKVPTIVVVITDGKSRDPSATKEEARKLHQLGVTVYAIGVGYPKRYDINELKSIASDPENGVYTVPSYSALKEMRQTFSEEVCKGCVERAADIMFVLDSSSNIWGDDYKRQLKFVVDLVERFGVGLINNHVRIGAITISDEAYLDFSLCHYTDFSQLQYAIYNIPHRGGGTNTSDALRLFNQVVPNLKYSKVPTIAIVITNGLSLGPEATVEANKLHELGVTVYAIGVGSSNQYDMNELKSIASDQENGVFTVSSYSELNNIKKDLYVQVFKGETTQPRHKTSTTSAPSTTTIPKRLTIN